MKPFVLFLLLLFSTFASAGEKVSDGRSPMGPLVMDGSGNLYGVTQIGGGTGCDGNDGCGTVFEYAP
jgi:hypothetical protein